MKNDVKMRRVWWLLVAAAMASMVVLFSLTREGITTFWWSDQENLNHLVVSRYYVDHNQFPREGIEEIRVVEERSGRRLLQLDQGIYALSMATTSTETVSDFDRYYQEIEALVAEPGASGHAFRLDANTLAFWLSSITAGLLWLWLLVTLIKRPSAGSSG